MKTIRELINLIESAQTPVAEGKNNIDNKIIHLMTNGIPADEIARKLDIPVEWVHEVAKYNMPDSAIDYNDPRNSTQGRERFGEQGVAEAQKPVAFIDVRDLEDGFISAGVTKNKQFDSDIPLYTHPVKELTKDMLWELAEKYLDTDDTWKESNVTGIDDFIVAILRKAQEK